MLAAAALAPALAPGPGPDPPMSIWLSFQNPSQKVPLDRSAAARPAGVAVAATSAVAAASGACAQVAVSSADPAQPTSRSVCSAASTV